MKLSLRVARRGNDGWRSRIRNDRKAFKEIDADGNGTIFEEFEIDADLEEGRAMMSGERSDVRMPARSARSLRTRLVDDFIETFSKNNDTYDAWLKENDEEEVGGALRRKTTKTTKTM